MTEDEEFALASRAFALFTLAEQRRAVIRLCELHYTSIAARFIDAVHYVITDADARSKTASGR